MSAYRSETANLARRVEELEAELAEVVADEQSPVVRARRTRDSRLRFASGILLLGALTGALFLGGVLAREKLVELRTPPPETPSPAARALATAESERKVCDREARGLERRLHDCELDLRKRFTGSGVDVRTEPSLEEPATVLLARYAPSVITCDMGNRTEVALTFGPDGALAKAEPVGLNAAASACVRGVLEMASSPELANAAFSATFHFP